MPYHNSRAAFALIALTLPAAAQADALFDRYRAASQTQSESMAAFMISRVPDLESVIPPAEWTDEAITVGACTMEAIRAERGEDGLEAYVAAIEATAAVEMTSLTALADATPELLNDPFFIEVAQTCGAMDLAMRQMQESGLLERMTQPEVMEALSAE